MKPILALALLVTVIVTGPAPVMFQVGKYVYTFTRGKGVPQGHCVPRSIYQRDNGELYLCWDTDLAWHQIVAARAQDGGAR